MSFLFSKSKNSIIFVPEKYTPNLAAKFTAKRIAVWHYISYISCYMKFLKVLQNDISCITFKNFM